METTSTPQIVRADKIGDGLLIYFDDGKAAFYPTTLLRAIFPEAVQAENLDLGEELASRRFNRQTN
jgi:hypothetical protein